MVAMHRAVQHVAQCTQQMYAMMRHRVAAWCEHLHSVMVGTQDAHQLPEATMADSLSQ